MNKSVFPRRQSIISCFLLLFFVVVFYFVLLFLSVFFSSGKLSIVPNEMGVARVCVRKLLDVVLTLFFHISLQPFVYFLDTSSGGGGDGSELEPSK